MLFEAVEAVVGPGFAGVAAGLAAVQGDELFARAGGEFSHQGGDVAKEAFAAAVLLVVDNEDGDSQLGERHSGDGGFLVVGEDRGGEDEAVGAARYFWAAGAGAGELGGGEGGGLGAVTGADEPDGNVQLLADPGDDGFDVGDMLGRGAKAHQKRRGLTIGGGVDDDGHQALVDEQVARADEEIARSPFEGTIGSDLQAAVAAGEEDDGRFGFVGAGRSEDEDAIGDAGAGGEVENFGGRLIGRFLWGRRLGVAIDEEGEGY